MTNVNDLSLESLEKIKAVVSEYTHVDTDDFTCLKDGKVNKERKYALSRQLYAIFLYRNTKNTLPEISHLVFDSSKATHAAVLSSLKTINKYLVTKAKPLIDSPVLATVFDEMDRKVANIIDNNDLINRYEELYKEIDKRMEFHLKEYSKYKEMIQTVLKRKNYFQFNEWYGRFSEEVAHTGFEGPLYIPSFKDAWLVGQDPVEFAVNYVNSRGLKVTE